MKAGFRAARYVSLSLLGAMACSQVLGIEDAHVDPTLSLGPSAGESPSSGGTGNANLGGSDGMSGGAISAGGSRADSGGSQGSGAGPTQGGGTTSLGGGSPMADAGAGGAVPETLCDQYCDRMTEFCKDSSLQYGDYVQCQKVCNLFDEGAVGGPDGNTVACRLKYAEKARYAAGTELNAYCRQAGPGGDGRCGSNCSGFCTIMTGTCTPSIAESYSYPNAGACQMDCTDLPDIIAFEYGSKAVGDGNSVGCRLFHVMSALMADAEEHCAHARGVTLCEAPAP